MWTYYISIIDCSQSLPITAGFFNESASWYCFHEANFWSACLSLIFCKFVRGAARLLLDTVHPLAPPSYRLASNVFSFSQNRSSCSAVSNIFCIHLFFSKRILWQSVFCFRVEVQPYQIWSLTPCLWWLQNHSRALPPFQQDVVLCEDM
jgi:hypothetical protein